MSNEKNTLGPLAKLALPFIKMMGPEKIGDTVSNLLGEFLTTAQSSIELFENETDVKIIIYKTGDKIISIPAVFGNNGQITRLGEAIDIKQKVIQLIENL